jgi:hypothetical protein
MKKLFQIAGLFALLGVAVVQASAQSHSMYVNAANLPLRGKPVATSPAMLKLGAKSRVDVLEPVKPGAWAQVMFSPYPGADLTWAGWVESKYLVAQRDSVKLPEGSYTVPKDERAFYQKAAKKSALAAPRRYKLVRVN